MSSSIDTILFDLGRVLIDLDGPPPLQDDWLSSPLSEEEKWQRWSASSFVTEYESGKISADDFVRLVIKDLHLNVSEPVFRKAFIDWPKGFLPGAESVLRKLRGRYRLAFYSNTSDMHLPKLMNEIGLANYFDHAFASFEIGYFKPDPQGFQHVLKAMSAVPEQVLFIDDLPQNVAGARDLGFKSEQALGFKEVEAALIKHGCI